MHQQYGGSTAAITCQRAPCYRGSWGNELDTPKPPSRDKLAEYQVQGISFEGKAGALLTPAC